MGGGKNVPTLMAHLHVTVDVGSCSTPHIVKVYTYNNNA